MQLQIFKAFAGYKGNIHHCFFLVIALSSAI